MPFSYDIDLDDTARARRRRASSSSLEVKGLGANLGSLARGAAVFDPNAIDGDGDGLVQDSTPFERPAPLSNVSALARGFASASGKWGEAYEGWTVGKTNEEIAEVAIPGSPQELVAYMAAHTGAYGLPRGDRNLDGLLSRLLRKFMGEEEERFDFSPETVSRARQMLVDSLNSNPQMRELIDRFGIPPIVVSKDMNGVSGSMRHHHLMKISKKTLDRYGTTKGKTPEIDDRFLLDAFGEEIKPLLDMLPSFAGENTKNEDLSGTFIHEYGHYLVSLASYNHPDPKVREMLFLINNETWENLADRGLAEQWGVPDEWHDLASFVISGHADVSEDEERELHEYFGDGALIPPSKYSLTNPAEMLAEMFADVMSEYGNPGNKDVVKTLTGDIKGFASSAGLPDSRTRRTMTPRQIAEEVVPNTPEEALRMMEEWSQFSVDMLGVDGGDDDYKGLSAAERLAFDLRRDKWYLRYHGNPRKWNKASRKARRDKSKVDPSEVFEFDPELVENAKQIVARTLEESPQMLEHVRDFGMPPVLITLEDDNDFGGLFFGTSGVMKILLDRKLVIDPDAKMEGEKAEKGIDGTEWFLESNGKWTPSAIISHEYGHYINFLSTQFHPDREARYLNGWYWRGSWDEVNGRGIGGYFARRRWDRWRRRNPGVKSDLADKRWSQSRELEEAIDGGLPLDWESGPPHVLSEYGQLSPSEMFAEGYAALVSGDPERMARVSPALKNDILLTTGRIRDQWEKSTQVDTSQAARSGFASGISITRNADGTRDMARAFSGEDDSPLKGSDWLKDATPKEIAQALIPRSPEDLVNLTIQHMLTGNTNPDPHSLAVMKEFMDIMVDSDLFDFSPEGIARMEQWLEKALNESPEFLWQVRRFGSGPIVPTDPAAVKRYRDARRTGQKVLIPSRGPRVGRQRLDYPIIPSGPFGPTPDEQAMSVMFDAIVNADGVLGFNVHGLMTVINVHHRGWRGMFDGTKPMPAFGRTRRVRLGYPRPGEQSVFPDQDALGRDLISNFSTSIEGTIIHEYNHGWWSSLFGPKRGLGTAPGLRDDLLRRSGLRRSALDTIGGDRYARARYFFPNLDPDEAVRRMEFAKEHSDSISLSIVPQPWREFHEWKRMSEMKGAAVYGTRNNPQITDITARIEAHRQEIIDRGLMRVQGSNWQLQMAMMGLDPNLKAHRDYFLFERGWDPVENENMWRGLAEDYPEIYGDPRLPFAGLAGMYAQKNPQETWAELMAMVSQPDKDYRDEFVTPEMMAAALYMLGEHSDPFDTRNIQPPWSGRGSGSGFASSSRTRKVEHARSTVSRRASNSIGNVASTSASESSDNRRISISRETEGHTVFSLTDYKFKIPGDRFMPDLSTAYTEWAGDSHYDIQQMSGIIMGIKRPKTRPAVLPGNRGVNLLLNDYGVSDLDSETLRDMRSSVANTKRLMDELVNGDSYSNMPLYHALAVMNDDDPIMKLSIGDDIYLPLTSFMPNQINPNDVPVVHSGDDFGDKGAILKLSMGARVINSNLLDSVNHQNEWKDVPIESITGGRFKVVNRDEKNGIPFIEIEHSDVFDTNKGEFVNVDPVLAKDAVREMVIIDRGIREVEKLHRERASLDPNSPQYGVLTDNIKDKTDEVVLAMFDGDITPPPPTMSISKDGQRKLIDEAERIRGIPVSSQDKVDVPGFASTSSGNGSGRTISPERRVCKSAIRMLEDNREYIVDRMLSGATRDVLDDEWIDRTIDRLNNGEISHTDAMDIMNLVIDIIGNRIRKDPSLRDATDGDIYHYQKLGKRLRRAMVAGISDEDMDVIRGGRGIKGGGFASTTSRVSMDLVEDFHPRVIYSPWTDGGDDDAWPNRFTSREKIAAVVYTINGEKVTFGIKHDTKIDISGIKNVPLNPYDITGLKRGSKEGEDMALKWVYANAAMSGNTNSTEVSALLYAGIRGDKKAMAKFEELAKSGEAAVKAQRDAEIAKNADVKLTKEQEWNIGRLSVWAAQQRAKAKGRSITLDEAEKIAKEEPFNINDVALVRWTEFPPEYDEEGNVILHPFSHYDVIGEDGVVRGVDRETIHFTLNHTVEEHMGWHARGGGYSIIIPLKDVIEDNPDSLDAIKDVDTYFTPAPGKGLKLRKGSVRVVKVDNPQDRQKLTNETLGDMGFIVVKGGPRYTDTPGFGDAVTKVERDLGRQRSSLHGEMPHYWLERTNATPGPNNFDGPENIYAQQLARMERNALLRLADKKRNPFIGESRESFSPPGGSFVSTSQRRDSRARGFASSTRDWKTTTHNIELRPDMPDSEIAHVEDGATTQKLVPVGNEVIHPRTGEKVSLDSQEKSTDFVAFGGNLSEVPDEHVIEAILRNTDNVPGEARSGWRLSKADGRFEFLGAGGGMHGMIRLRDTKTGAMLGLKYEASSSISDSDLLYPVSNWSAQSSLADATREVVANSFMEQLGFPPMPIRIVRRSSLGAGDSDPNSTLRRHGVAYITEMAQNRHQQILGDGMILDYNAQAREGIQPIAIIRMRLLDALLNNRDRNWGNYLIASQSDGSVVPVPIDHGMALDAGWSPSITDLIKDKLTGGIGSIDNLKSLSRDEMRSLIKEIMKDYRQDAKIKQEKIIAEARRAMEHSASLMSSTPGGDLSQTDMAWFMRDIEQGAESAIKRWNDLIEMSDDDIADLIYEGLGGK